MSNEQGLFTSPNKTGAKLIANDYENNFRLDGTFISTNNYVLAKRNDTISNLDILGGTTWGDGAYLQVFGKDSEYNKGAVCLATCDINTTNDRKYFFLRPNGEISWYGYLISQLSMPSNKYIELEIGANNFIYTSIANGYLAFHATSTQSSSGAFILLFNENTGVSSNIISTGLNQGLICFIPISKGQQIKVSYGGVSIDYLRFVYSVLDSRITE